MLDVMSHRLDCICWQECTRYLVLCYSSRERWHTCGNVLERPLRVLHGSSPEHHASDKSTLHYLPRQPRDTARFKSEEHLCQQLSALTAHGLSLEAFSLSSSERRPLRWLFKERTQPASHLKPSSGTAAVETTSPQSPYAFSHGRSSSQQEQFKSTRCQLSRTQRLLDCM